jgi:phosphoglycolate phosphatase
VSTRLCETEGVPTSRPALIFDLDGTLTDSKPGILACLEKALEAHNVIDAGQLDRFIGPPVEEWAAELLPHATPEARLALAHDYRACYEKEGWENNSLYPGIPEALARLQQLGFPLYVCTSKRYDFAQRILDVFKLTPFFTAIYGDRSEYPTRSKVDLLAFLLREQALLPAASETNPALTPWMIGDRIFDIRAARANHVRSLAAAWGYGNAEEWSQADATAATVSDIIARLAPEL